MVLKAVMLDGLVLQYAPSDLRRDREVVLKAVHNDPRALEYALEELRDDEAFMEDVVGISGRALLWAPTRFRGVEPLVRKAVEHNPYALYWPAGRVAGLGLDATTAHTSIIEAYGMLMALAGPELADPEGLVMAMVEQDGLAIRYASMRLRDDKRTALAAVGEAGDGAMAYISERLARDEEVVGRVEQWRAEVMEQAYGEEGLW